MVIRFTKDCIPVINISGNVDYNSCKEAANHIKYLLDTETKQVSMEMDSIESIDNNGLITLISLAENAKERGKSIKINSLNTLSAKMLHHAGAMDIFDIPSNIEIKPMQDLQIPKSELIEIDITPTKNDCRMARNYVATFAYQMGFGQDDLDDIKLAMGEALSNAIRHGSSDIDNIYIFCNSGQSKIDIRLKYKSNPFNPEEVPEPDLSFCCEGGMGIYFIRKAMDNLAYSFSDGFATVSMTKYNKN